MARSPILDTRPKPIILPTLLVRRKRFSMPRMVQCVKFGRELPGLEALPFAGPLGERIYNQVSQQAWNLWPAQATLIINHYGLNLADPQAQQLLMQAMEEFF